MKKVVSVLLIVVLMAGLVLTGCSQSSANEEKKVENGKRSIVDLTGETVEIPVASELNRVVLMGPPLFATYMSAVKDGSKLVGVNPNSFKEANANVLKLIMPNWESVNTAFISGQEVNVEEVLNLQPDIILVYGQDQKEAFKNTGIPVVDFNSAEDEVNESISSDKLLRTIFEIDEEGFLADEWKKVTELTEKTLKKVGNVPSQKAMIIGTNTANEISIRGPGSFGNVLITKSGLTDVTAELNASSIGVSMEQVYTWNPEIIYLFKGTPAKKYLANAIENQDWSEVTAFTEKRIYDVPKGTMNWGSPSPDSPLMMRWLLSKNYPEFYSQTEFETAMKEYYQKNYNIELTDELMNSILYPNGQ